MNDITFREEVTPEDIETVREIVASTGFFTPAEVDVAVELVQERLNRGPASGYFFLFAEQGGKTLGYACYGPIACTVASYDLFWIVVHNQHRHQGLGRRLLRASEEKIAQAGGLRIYAETSSKAQYAPTRQFYERNGYVAEATLVDFYAPGDGKVVYVRSVKSA